MNTIYLSLLIFLNTFSIACNNKQTDVIAKASSNSDAMKVKITVGQTVLTATMVDNPTTRDFLFQLPMTLSIEDYASTEKISSLPKKLTTKDAPAGYKPVVGDIAYYAPWGNLALYYKDFSYSTGLILLGKLDGDVSALTNAGSNQMTLERM